MKKQLLILCGGRSAEHEVSLVSASNIVRAVDRSRFDVHIVAIDHKGYWHALDREELLFEAASRRSLPFKKEKSDVSLIAQEKQCHLWDMNQNTSRTVVDVVFPVLHGPFGEDGSLQGWLKGLNVACVGSGVLGSAVGMDKDVMKRLLKEAGLPIADFRVVHRHTAGQVSFSQISQELGSPVFVKSANMGSSIGVHKVSNAEQWQKALANSFLYDHKVIVEKFVPGREIECAVLGNEPNVKASVCGEIKPNHDFYSYEAKYLDDNGANLIIPAQLPAPIMQKIQELAIRTFQVLCCDGLARVDFFVQSDGTILINEINTLPGFTSISMYPKMWEASGISYSDLITQLIDLGVAKFAADQSLKQTLE